MNRRFPKKWYEVVLLIVSAYVFIMEGFSASTLLFADRFISPLIPDYAACMVTFIHLAIVLGTLCGLAETVFCFAGKRVGWCLLTGAVLFFTYLHIYYATNINFQSFQETSIFIYGFMILGLLGVLLSGMKSIFAVRVRDVMIALMLPAAMIFMHAGAYNVALFWAVHFNKTTTVILIRSD